VDQPRDVPLELVIGLRADVAELRATVTHLAAEMADLRHEVRGDIRRLDNGIFQLTLAQLATLGTALASLVAAIS
jgi:hypothetical protein